MKLSKTVKNIHKLHTRCGGTLSLKQFARANKELYPPVKEWAKRNGIVR